MIARSCRSSRCPRFGRAWPESPTRRPQPCLPHRQQWRAHRRDCAAGGGSPEHPSPSNLARMAAIRCTGSVLTGPPWTHAPSHGAASAPTSPVHHARVVHRTSPARHMAARSAPGVNPQSSHAYFAENPLCFRLINPQSRSIQKKYNLVLFLLV